MPLLRASKLVNYRPSEFLFRVKSALRSPDALRRLTDFIWAGLLFRLPASLRRTAYAGSQYYCPICESHLKKFLGLHRDYYKWCPVCRSLQRHRLGWLMLNSAYVQIKHSPKRMLHIAPERSFLQRLQNIEGLEYISADLYDPKAMVKLDVGHIQFPDNSFDLLYCSHVLEHVPDDQKAMGEFWRILKPGGKAIIIVPITAEKTYEDLSITDPVERLRLFGQHDHVRNYGPDIAKRLEKTGIETRPLYGCIPTQQPAYAYLKEKYAGKLPNAEYVGSNGFYIGCHQYLEQDHLDHVAEAFSALVRKGP